MLRAGDTVIDAGAGFGVSALVFSKVMRLNGVGCVLLLLLMMTFVVGCVMELRADAACRLWARPVPCTRLKRSAC